MTTEKKQDVLRNLRNFSTSPYWNAIMDRDEVNMLLQEYSDSVFCNGHLRQIKVDAITNETFKVYTVPF